MFGHERQALSCDHMRRSAKNRHAGQPDVALRATKRSGNRPHRCGLADTIAAEKSQQFTVSDRKIDALQDVAFAVPTVEAGNRKYRSVHHAVLPRYVVRTAGLVRIFAGMSSAILRPAAMTVIRSEISSTTLILCSIRSTAMRLLRE